MILNFFADIIIVCQHDSFCPLTQEMYHVSSADESKWIGGLACEDRNVELMCINNGFQVIKKHILWVYTLRFKTL